MKIKRIKTSGREGMTIKLTARERAVDKTALRIAREFDSDPDERAQVKVSLAIRGMPLVADMIDQAVVMARELIRLATERRRKRK